MTLREPVCKFSVVCQKQQPLGVEVESSHRIHPRAAAGYQLGDVFAPLFIGQRTHIAARLVEHQHHALGLLFKPYAVDLNDVFLIVCHIPETCRVTIDAHAALQNHLLCLPAGRYAVV